MKFLERLKALRRNWQAADRARLQLDELLASADPNASLVVQNEWLVELGYWLRRKARLDAPSEPTFDNSVAVAAPTTEPFLPESLVSTRPGSIDSSRRDEIDESFASAESPGLSRLQAADATVLALPERPARPSEALTRLRYVLRVLERNGETRERVAATLQSVLRQLDAISLLCDTGLPQSPGLWGELRERLAARTIPATPHTDEWSVLLSLLFPHASDTDWIAEIDRESWQQAQLLFAVAGTRGLDSGHGHGMADVAASIRVLVSQVCAAALTSSIRSRMRYAEFSQSPFLPFASAAEELLQEGGSPDMTDAQTLQRLNVFRGYLEECRIGALAVFEHLDENGVSVDIEFRVEGIVARLARIEMLLEFWLQPDEPAAGQRVLANLVKSHQQSRSISTLLRQSFARLARKVVDRSAETGEHYIARSRDEYRAMLKAALGGGVITVLTVYLKFAITSAHLHRFFEGLAASANYSVSFVLIHFAGFTLATKQPAMTAPALAAKLDGIGKSGGMDDFVQETLSLMRSQAAAVLGNVLAVIPIAFLIQWGAHQLFGVNLLSVEKARATIESFSILGPTPLYAAFTGGLLWASAVIAGWADNWFVYRRIGDVIAYHRRLRFVLGEARAMRWASFWREHISGVVGNVALGFLLGMAPIIAESFALPLEVRHVTLSSGSIAAAVGVLGLATIGTWSFWLAVAGIVSMAFLNVGVSFFLAFQVALRSRDLPRLERSQIYRAIARAIIAQPRSLFVVTRARPIELSGVP
jgi:site-specific recombinase